MHRQFRSFASWSKVAKQYGATIVKTATSGDIVKGYEAALLPSGKVFGFFQDAPRGWMSAKSFGWLDLPE